MRPGTDERSDGYAAARLRPKLDGGHPYSMPSKTIDFDVVREIALELPDVEESTIQQVVMSSYFEVGYTTALS